MRQPVIAIDDLCQFPRGQALEHLTGTGVEP
jgi:hypothetical protein